MSRNLVKFNNESNYKRADAMEDNHGLTQDWNRIATEKMAFHDSLFVIFQLSHNPFLLLLFIIGIQDNKAIGKKIL